jgi:hypothetical protein
MQLKALTNFYEAIRENNRISPSHISLFMALFQCWNLNEFQNPFFISRRQIMQSAKISGLATYHRCIRDLHQFGYIHYQPSYNLAIYSQVAILVKV